MAKWLKLKGEEEVSDFNKENVKKTHEEVPFTKPYHFHVSDFFIQMHKLYEILHKSLKL